MSSKALPCPGSTIASNRPPAISTSASRTPSSVTTRPPRIARSAVATRPPARRDGGAARCSSHLFDDEVLRALPEREAADLGEFLVTFDHCREVIACELADLAGEEAGTIRKEDLHLGDAAGIDEDLAR